MFVDLQLQGRHFGQHMLRDSAVDQHDQAPPRHGGQEQLAQLIAHPLRGNDADARGHLLHGLGRVRGQIEAELRGEPRGTHHPQGVIAEGDLGGGWGPQAPLGERVEAVIRVAEAQVGQPQGHGVDGEVPAPQVVFELVPEGDDRLAGHPVIGIGAIGRDLDAGLTADAADGAEVAPDVPGRIRPGSQQSLDLGRARTGGEVQVDGRAPEEGITHRPADQRQLVSGGGKELPELGQQGQRGAQMRHRAAHRLGVGGFHESQPYAAADGCSTTHRAPRRLVSRRDHGCPRKSSP